MVSGYMFGTTVQISLFTAEDIRTPFLEMMSFIHMAIVSVLTASQLFISSAFDLPRRSGDIVMTMPGTIDNGSIDLVTVLQHG